MLIADILLMAGLALILRLASAWLNPGIRGWMIFASSVVALFWLQPVMPVRSLDFWLPLATLALAMLGWLLTAPAGERLRRVNLTAGGMLAGLVLLVALTRYAGGGDWLTAARPPPIEVVLAVLGGLSAAVAGFALAFRGRDPSPALLVLAMVFLIALLILLKSPVLALEAGRGLRVVMGQNPALATAVDIRWLGFSYICFRLVHTLRDRQNGRLPDVNLAAYISYIVFFPALVAGPIDRLERFARDLHSMAAVKPAAAQAGKQEESQPEPGRRAPGALGIVPAPAVVAAPALDPALQDDLSEAARRITLGLFKKFAIADTLALIALAPANALQVRETGWMWLLVYLYAFQIYFDFSGYTDIAIGLGRLFGIKLPENFNRPYLKPNLTQFWNAWHITLTMWFRAYFFNPFVRWLRVPHRRLSPWLVLLLSQVSTMLLIGLWHGVTVNFVLWGAWHGFGLYAQNRWSEAARAWFAARDFSPVVQRGLHILAVVLTFHYVALGWVWFVLPQPSQSVAVFRLLFGGGG